MHKGLFLLLACLFAGANLSRAQSPPTPLQVRLICQDIYMYPALTKRPFPFNGITDQNQVSSQGRFSTPNDEFALAPQDIPTTHWGTFFYTDGQLFETFALPFQVDIPGNDVNQNGIFDLLEYSQSVTAVNTFGTYTDPDGQEGVFRATWTKAADAYTGTCQIIFDFTNPSGFTHSFEILSYQGTWSSAVKENSTVHGPIDMTRDVVAGQTFTGELALSLATPGEVHLTSTTLTNEQGSTFEWAPPTKMDRVGTGFYELLTVTDGWLYEPTADFMDWLIVIDDKNDGDGDGIPDLIDPPTVTQATAPTMQIIKTDSGIRLMITGDVGRAYTLEDAPSLPTVQWLHPTAVTLTASPHVLDLPAPTAPTFWRMRFP